MKFLRRHRFGAAFAATVLALLVGFSVTTAVQAERIREERDRANTAAREARRDTEKARQVTGFLTQIFEAADPTNARGAESTAGDLVVRGLERISSLDSQPEVQASLRTTLGGVLLNFGRFSEAAPVIEAAVRDHETRAAEDPAALARSLHLLATVYDNGQNDPERAIPIANRAIALWQSLDNSLMKAASLNTLANALWHSGDLDAAAETFQDVITIQERELGAGTPEITMALANLGSIHLTRGHNAEALECYERVRTIEEAQPDANRNPSHGTTLHLLALAYDNTGREQDAIDVEGRSLQIRETVYGPDHWHVALSLTTLGDLYRRNGRATKAVELLKRAVKIAEATWDAHPDLWWSQRTLARALIATGVTGEAEVLMTPQAATMRERGKSQWLAEVLEISGAAAHAAGSIASAEVHYGEAIAIMDRMFPPNDPDRIRAVRAFADVLRANGKADAAAKIEATISPQ